jgi:very-short-patch-repair endonuclease
MSAEGRANIGAAVKLRWQDPEQREKMRAVGRRPAPTSETKLKMAEARRQIWDSPESRARRSEAMRRRWATEPNMGDRLAEARRRPETREKMRQARLRRKDFPRTDIEILLAREFRALGLSFEEQKPMFGRFIPDFVFEDGHLIVQADGEYWHRFERNRRYDGMLRDVIADTDWRLIRFGAVEIKADPAALASLGHRMLTE